MSALGAFAIGCALGVLAVVIAWAVYKHQTRNKHVHNPQLLRVWAYVGGSPTFDWKCRDCGYLWTTDHEGAWKPQDFQ
jgi:hypothetical protein